MPHFDKPAVAAFTATVDAWIEAKCSPGKSRMDVTTGVTAWEVAHLSGIVREAYQAPNTHDAHIQTVLKAIFPNAQFAGRKAA